MDEHITVAIPTGLLRRVRQAAADEGRTVDSLVAEGLTLEVQRVAAKRHGRTDKGKLPPVSKATGGVRSGVDIANSAQMQELEDEDSIERLKNGFR
jgi:hypothetical protein